MDTKQLMYGGGIVVLLLLVALGLSSLTQKDPLPSETTTSKGEVLSGNGIYKIDPLSSTLEWKGSKSLLLDYNHQGTINVATGTLRLEDGKVVEGKVVFDMKTIKVTKDGKGAPVGGKQLQGHLTSKDFFDVAQYPASVFTLIGLSPDTSESAAANSYLAKGSLTIKGITKEIMFPVVAYFNTGTLHIEGSAKVDRTQWGVKYASGKFFKSLGDKVIDDEFTLSFDLSARTAFDLSQQPTISSSTLQ